MLQNRLIALVWLIRCGCLLAIPFWVYMGYKFTDDGSDTTMFAVYAILGSLVSIGYVLIRFGLEKQALENYIWCLENHDTAQALTYGRQFYALRRNGLKGAGATNLTIYDEQAINNDIAAYK